MALISKTLLNRHIPNLNSTDARARLRELELTQRSITKHYDVFLSHNFKDALIIFGLAQLLKSAGLAVFVDWLEAPGLDREAVTPATAEYLRRAMKQSSSLLYAVSGNSSNSKWMPWELGFSDGLHGSVAIVPIEEFETAEDTYRGREYLGLYPYVTAESLAYGGGFNYYVRKPGQVSKTRLSDWIK